ncbi:Oidioi.mRNA.OKI2018_I69.chr1.g3592.t1.cds [Oikopleura dioica]|uniref:Oidioi.mRNA.OKI2018_I69.chr1.g3592.t1.cds n=1 Tax=Oikopleura dioica TaxID=34765 RepID=A0ABN7T1F1_OIKDI|nr:Oidioi.mRNA.OKI2018_I69.chr1.g3592.t1.cds [Oikopleura dioica]
MKSRIVEEIRPVEETPPPKIKKPKGRQKKKTVEEEIRPMSNDLPRKRQKKDQTKSENDPLPAEAKRSKSRIPVRIQKNPIKETTAQKGPKSNELANVRCLECHAVGTVMKTIHGIVLFPNKVKKTLLELGGGILMPNIKKVKPTVKIANKKAKKFVEGFNQLEDNKEDEENDGLFQRSVKRVQNFRARFASGVKNAKGEKKFELVKMIEREKTKTPAKDVPERFTGFFSDEFEKDNFWKSKKRFSLHGNATMPQFAVYMLFGCIFWGIVVGITNYYSMLAARIQPTYLTNVCQAGFKNCTVTNNMDYCAHLLHDCIGTGNFTQPAVIKIQGRPVEPPLTFTDKENDVNQQRCKKQKFYAMFFKITL